MLPLQLARKVSSHLMLQSLAIVLALYVGYLVVRTIRRPTPQTLQEFFSFGTRVDGTRLRDAFFVTNASFATAFVSLFLFVGSQGILSIVTPLAFVFGALFYTYVLLPRHIEILSSGKRYPELLGNANKTPIVRVAASLFVILSLWLFTYTEILVLLDFLEMPIAHP